MPAIHRGDGLFCLPMYFNVVGHALELVLELVEQVGHFHVIIGLDRGAQPSHKITDDRDMALEDDDVLALGQGHAAGGIGSPCGVIVPATASPATTVTSISVTRLRTPSPRSASAVAVICAWPVLVCACTIALSE